jgi:hypothetical protein
VGQGRQRQHPDGHQGGDGAVQRTAVKGVSAAYSKMCPLP